MYQEIIERAARAISNADALLIGAGAGMGVDSGLPDFRGDQGFWNAYPPFKGKKFNEIAQPRMFIDDPTQAWGFYGHRMHLYRNTVPHAGFNILRSWAEKLGEYFVFTSNVDGHFCRSGFDEQRVVECHGTTRFMQCAKGIGCSREVWSCDEVEVAVDEETFRATGELPKCIICGVIARPNILMFGDIGWVPFRTSAQEDRYEQWFRRVKDSNLVAIEFGAGTAIPTVRYECQRRSKKLIRVNPRDYRAPDTAISIPMNALDAITAIDAQMNRILSKC